MFVEMYVKLSEVCITEFTQKLLSLIPSKESYQNVWKTIHSFSS